MTLITRTLKLAHQNALQPWLINVINHTCASPVVTCQNVLCCCASRCFFKPLLKYYKIITQKWKWWLNEWVLSNASDDDRLALYSSLWSFFTLTALKLEMYFSFSYHFLPLLQSLFTQELHKHTLLSALPRTQVSQSVHSTGHLIPYWTILLGHKQFTVSLAKLEYVLHN